MRPARPLVKPVASAASRNQAIMLRRTTGPRRFETTFMRSARSCTAPASRSPSLRIGLPLISLGLLDPVALEDRRRQVGREHESRGAGGVGGEVPVEALARGPDRQHLALGRRRTLEGDQHVVPAQTGDQRRQLAQRGRHDRDARAAAIETCERPRPPHPARAIGRHQRRRGQQRVRSHRLRRRALLAQGRGQQSGHDLGRRVLGAIAGSPPSPARGGRSAGTRAARRRRAR